MGDVLWRKAALLLRTRFAPDPAALPGVVARLAPLNDYDVLLGDQFEVAA